MTDTGEPKVFGYLAWLDAGKPKNSGKERAMIATWERIKGTRPSMVFTAYESNAGGIPYIIDGNGSVFCTFESIGKLINNQVFDHEGHLLAVIKEGK